LSADGAFVEPAKNGSIQTITITATSVQDGTKSGTATVTIAAAQPTVTGVTVSPSAPSLAGGATQQFAASVAGANSPSQGVTWSTNKGQISAGGLLTAPAVTASAQTGTVTATSTLDPTKSGTATFTIPAAVVAPVTRTVSLVLGEIPGPAVNLTGIMVSFHAAPGPHATGTALYQSASETTDASGLLSFTVDGSAIAAGATGLLAVLMPDGRHYLGLVAVA
jgi:hypothetical protein